jgi:glutaminyl-peptide cyclotransferase
VGRHKVPAGWNPLSVRVAALAALLCTGCDRLGGLPSLAPIAAASARIDDLQAATPASPPPRQPGGFDGKAAFAQVAKLVSFGPRPPATDGIHRTQDYIRAELRGFGCALEEDDFHAQTPIGELPMKNLVAKVPGSGPGIILLLTHYDTARKKDFVGAEDGGSSTGLMLEMARRLCGAPKQTNAVWIAFLDGEEAQVQWSETDSVYGSRELAARLAISGDLKRIRAVILADMIGQNGLEIARDTNSTKWLTDLVWTTAARLGYRSIFVERQTAVEDDHGPFLRRGVPAVDIIDLDGFQPYWHTAQDTLDKVSPASLAVVGQVILESVAELQKRFR